MPYFLHCVLDSTSQSNHFILASLREQRSDNALPSRPSKDSKIGGERQAFTITEDNEQSTTTNSFLSQGSTPPLCEQTTRTTRTPTVRSHRRRHRVIWASHKLSSLNSHPVLLSPSLHAITSSIKMTRLFVDVRGKVYPCHRVFLSMFDAQSVLCSKLIPDILPSI